jgi:hypothetical protein
MGSFRFVGGCVTATAAAVAVTDAAIVKELLLDKLEVEKEDPLLFISYAK